MNLSRYEFRAGRSFKIFEFVSVGPKGNISKLIKYSHTNFKDVYNLAFGDKNTKTGEIDDKVVSNNGDREKILATVAASVYAFTEKHKKAWIYATGSSDSRTRLYRIGINKYLMEARKDFEIYGLKDQEWESYEAGTSYDAFLIKRKLITSSYEREKDK